jgi:NADH:ubiquinone oxidoreductase subunit K
VSTPTSPTKTESVKMGRLWWAGLLAAVVAAIGNILVLLITDALFTVPDSFPPFAIGPVTFFSVVGVVGATIVFALLGRFTKRPIYWFWIISIVVLLLSFIPNIVTLVGNTLPGTNVAGVVSLMIMHVVAAAAAVGILIRVAGERHA